MTPLCRKSFCTKDDLTNANSVTFRWFRGAGLLMELEVVEAAAAECEAMQGRQEQRCQSEKHDMRCVEILRNRKRDNRTI